MYAPLALFVYNRLELTKQVIAQLLTNTLAYETELYVFSDGGRDEQSSAEVRAVREYMHELEKDSATRHLFKSVTIVERPENWGANRNITEGVNYVFKDHETVIVLEDDIFVSEFFLDYMNTSFGIYEKDEKVMHVSAFSNLDLINDHPLLVYDNPYSDLMNETYFTPHMSDWGWGTWRDRWEKHFKQFGSEAEALEGVPQAMRDKMQYEGNYPCLELLKKSPIPWNICWEIAIYKADGVCLTPGYTLVRNIGLRSGSHFTQREQLSYYNFDRTPAERLIKVNRRPIAPKADIEALFTEAIKDNGLVYTPLGKVARVVMQGGQGLGDFTKSSGSVMAKTGRVLGKVGGDLGKLLVKFGGKAGVALKKFGAEAGKASVKYGGQLGVLLVKLGKVLLVLLKRLLQEIVRATPYVVGFFQQLFRLIADGIKKLINLIMSKM